MNNGKRAKKDRTRVIALYLALAGALISMAAATTSASAQTDSLGEKVKKLFATPTPTPHKRHKSSPTPTPSSSPKKKSTPKPSPSASASKAKAKSDTGGEEEESPTPTATPKKKTTPKPSPSASASKTKNKSGTSSEEEESPTPSARAHHRKKSTETEASPSKSPRGRHGKSPTPTPSEEETPTPSPAEEQQTPTPTPTSTAEGKATGKPSHAAVASVSPSQIVSYDQNPPAVRQLLDRALALTTQNLDYKYGSADPASGGMDCSGFIYYVLSQGGLKDVPRDSREQYVWVRKAGAFQAVIGRRDDTFELDALKPGDLLFWTGTYQIDRDPPVTHTMIYLGKEKGTNQRIMVGSSDGRTYKGQSRFGVSVFDFKVPTHSRNGDNENGNGTHPMFIGYAHIPGLGE